MRTILLTLLVAALAQAQPYNPVVLWDRSGAGEESWYGVKIVPLGDQNDDGYADFAVWAGGGAAPGDSSEERLEFFHGGHPPQNQPYMTFRGSLAPEREIRYFSGVGDVNGDGYEDWEIWWQYASAPANYEFQIFWGGPNADEMPDLVLHGPTDQDVFPLGDFNGDGFDDLVIYRPPPADVSYVLYGSIQPDTLPDLVLHSVNSPFQALPRSFGDLNGDGCSDFVSGSPNEQITYVYLGGVHPDTLPAYTWGSYDGWPYLIADDLNGDGRDDLVMHGLYVHFGRDLLLRTPDYHLNFYDACSPLWKFSLGDINGDGYGDMAVIDDGCNNLWGTMCIYLGHPWLNLDPAITIQGRDWPLNLVGIRTAAGLGDVNGDGTDDFAIGAANTNFDGRRGQAVVISGDTSLRVDVGEPRLELPRNLAVSVFPNPFNAECTVLFDVPPYIGEVELTVYNLLGQVVRQATLQNVVGTTRYHFDAAGLPSGMYLLHARTGSFTNTQKLMVLR